MRRLGLVVTILLCSLALAGPAGAGQLSTRGVALPSPAALSSSITWTKSTNGPALVWDAVAFAGSTCRLVQFGGTDGTVMPTGTNLFDPATGTWTTIAAPRRGSWPSYRTLARMAWDPIRQRVILFGGRDASGRPLNDTWAFDPVAKTWASLTPTCPKRGTCARPPARFAHGMAWSSALGKVVMYGGEASANVGVPTFLDDTWAFDGTAWQRIASTGPGGRSLFGMAEDAATGRILVYGGIATYPYNGGVSIEPTHDVGTWLLDPAAASWTRVATPTVPEMRAEMGMAYVARVGGVVMTTGVKPTGCMSWTNGAYVYDPAAKDWRPLAAGLTLPTPRNAANLTANLCDGSAILTGGTGDNQLAPITLTDRTWILR